MSDIKRWKIEVRTDSGSSYLRESLCGSGKWVRFKDYNKVAKAFSKVVVGQAVECLGATRNRERVAVLEALVTRAAAFIDKQCETCERGGDCPACGWNQLSLGLKGGISEEMSYDLLEG